ncbi:MAG: lactate racemase domain-containing protein [Megasphaera massiliensis]|uniref:lactate racemase domain-containing protein n=1 Tax=Megasphaera massiliensis TaxID=1232428 RepID=UPI002A751A07|nr:lactate racemase domain-containing protein [Megasphaera massiliensis]MDY2966604.1 lactate racemase domain-containing protein [Megasphaera massiliensis]
MEIFDELLHDISIPKFVKVRYEIKQPHLENPGAALRDAIAQRNILENIKPGDSVCIACGSREIANLAEIVRALVQEIKLHGGDPFIIPAMGSHGGATAEGQKEILINFGLDEGNVGAPIRATMETVYVGQSASNLEVRLDKYASEADWIIPVGRIKPHTAFHGPIESGVQKMITIGMGKQHGADICHSKGFGQMSKNVHEFAHTILSKYRNINAIGIIENAYHETYKIIAFPHDTIEGEEPGFLEEARSLMPKIPFNKVDAIFIDELGKNISGTGADSNIIGRSPVMGKWEPNADAIVMFDLTDESHGNVTGIGNADVTTMRVYNKFDMKATYPNNITSRVPKAANIPPVMPNDILAMKFGLKICFNADVSLGPKVVWLHNTLMMQQFLISESLIPEAEKVSNLVILSEPQEVSFDEDGNIAKGFLINT